jgi:hypothetical protein
VVHRASQDRRLVVYTYETFLDHTEARNARTLVSATYFF